MSASRNASIGGFGRFLILFGGLRVPAVLHLLGSALVLIGERVIGGVDTTRYMLDAAGALCVLAGFGLAARARSEAPAAQRGAHTPVLVAFAVAMTGFAVVGLGSDTVVSALAFAEDDAERRYKVIVNAAWALLWLGGTLPLIWADRALAANPVLILPRRVQEAFWSGLSLALALAMLFPLNYLGAEYNHREDYGYFKTARPGTSTVALVQGLSAPIKAYLFFPSSSEVTDELKTYFGDLAGPTFEVAYVDHALEPELAKELKVRENGTIALVRGEGDDQQVERVKIGEDFDSARRKLKKLDEEVREALFKIARDKKTAYFVTGHGELDWAAGASLPDKVTTLKKILQQLNYKVKELSLATGLAAGVPEDASIVFLLGPKSPLLPEEMAALDRFRAQGGSLMVAAEPGGADLSVLLAPVGVAVAGAGPLANDSKFVPATMKDVDRVNIVTNKYSTHASVTTLSRNANALVLILAGAAALDELPGAAVKPTVTIRSLADTWQDLDGDYAFDDGAEARKTWNLAMAADGPVPGGGEEQSFRVVVVSDATFISDLALVVDPNKANFQYTLDILAWLGRDDAAAGTVNSEEDVKIQHTKEGQGWIFTGTAFGVPALVLGLGMVRLRLRRKRGDE